VIVAPPAARPLLRELADRRIGWALRPPYEPAELCFVVAAALATGDPADRRNGLRVPIELAATLDLAGSQRRGVILNLSVDGAYVALPDRPGIGQLVTLGFCLGERELRVPARVAHHGCAPASMRREERGMGLAFGEIGAPERTALQDFVRERVGSFRLRT
jgi:hypothetical protein